MNGRQAARAAAKRIEELEHVIGLNKRDIIIYNECILAMIDHRSPCDFCHDYSECKEAGKDLTIGCSDWMIRGLDDPAPVLAQWQEDVIDGIQTGLFGAGGMD